MTEEIEVRLFDSMNSSPASQLAVAGWLHGETSGFGTGELNMHHAYKAYVAYLPEGHEKVGVGVLTWDHNREADSIWIFQAFVVEEHRGKGIFTEMLNFMIAKAMELKACKIELGTSLRNKHALEVYRKTGFEQKRAVLTLEVPKV